MVGMITLTQKHEKSSVYLLLPPPPLYVSMCLDMKLNLFDKK